MSAVVRCLECGAAIPERDDPLCTCDVCGLEMLVIGLYGGTIRMRVDGLPTGGLLTEELERVVGFRR